MPKGPTDYQKVNLPDGTVTTPTMLLAVIKRAAAYSAARFRGKVLVDMEPVTHKCWVSVKANYGVMFSQNLADILGLKTELYAGLLTEGVRPIDVMAGLSQMYIYSSVVVRRPVGDASAALLRELVVKGRAFQPTDIEFAHPHYVDAEPLDTDVVEIQIADSLGRPYEFLRRESFPDFAFQETRRVTAYITGFASTRHSFELTLSTQDVSVRALLYSQTRRLSTTNTTERQAGEGLQVYPRTTTPRTTVGSRHRLLVFRIDASRRPDAQGWARRASRRGGLAAAANVAGDFVRGDNLGASAKKHFAAQGKGSS